MYHRGLAVALVAISLVMGARPASADDGTLLRVFLKDGTSLVSFGEPARVGDRIVFSMPTAATPNPPLHLVDLPIAQVDWDRTNRYAIAARAAHYVATQADADYATLSDEVAQTLNDVARLTDSGARLVAVERARNKLADWPPNHYNYRQSDVSQMLAMLDAAIADLRAARGDRRFDINLSAYADPPSIPEPLLPPPTAQEAVEELLLAARVVDTSAERTSLLSTAVAVIDRDKSTLPAEWAVTARANAQAAIHAEVSLDRSYSALTTQMMTLADQRARSGDVLGIERVLRAISQRDQALGNQRPEAVTALLAAVEARLDAARQLQLARDRWALRAPELRAYGNAITTPMDLLARLNPALEAIKALSGSGPAALASIQRTVARISTLISAIAPPEELAAPHALLISAVQLAGHAAEIRREATLAGDMARAWDASSAAAGALMLGARASGDIHTLLRPPQLK
jgi:hypothetical protein